MKKPFLPDPSLCLLPLFFLKTPLWDIAIFLLCVLLHELGHLFAIRLLGYHISGLSLSLGGAKIFLEEKLIPYKKEIMIFLCGPVFNLLGCAVGFLLLRLAFTRYALLFFFSNFFLSLFNLLPLPGLDGEGVLSAFLSLCLSAEKRDEILERVEKIALFFLLLLSVTILVRGKNPSLFLLALCLLQEKKRKKATNIS